MPTCGLKIDGVNDKWAENVSIVTRLNKAGRLVQAHKNDTDMKACNKDASHNAAVLTPLLQFMSEDADWQLFNLGAAKKEKLASTRTN